MFCSNCGSTIEDDSTFCIVCGSPVEGVEEPSQGAPAPGVSPTNAVLDAGVVVPVAPGPEQAPGQNPFASDQGSDSPFAPKSAPGQTVGSVFPNAGQTQPQPGMPVQPAVAPKKKSSLPIFIAIAAVAIIILVGVIVALTVSGDGESSSSSSASTSRSSSSASSSSSSGNSSSTSGGYELSATTNSGQRLSGTVRRDSSGYVLPDSSSRQYTLSELRAMNLSPAEICVAWNEPFARLGYHFGNSDLAAYFNSCSWYTDRGIKPNLSGVGAKNNELLRTLADEMGEAALWKDLVLDNN